MGKARTNQSGAVGKKKATEEKKTAAAATPVVAATATPVVAAADKRKKKEVPAAVDKREEVPPTSVEKKKKRPTAAEPVVVAAPVDKNVEEKEEEKPKVKEEEEEERGYSDLDDDELLELALKADAAPTTATASKKKKSKKQLAAKKKEPSKANVLYLGHIPTGFHENEMKKFLEQFGKLAHVRVSRSKKTGQSRGYAFLQFQNPQVAEIVQKTLHGYILLGRALVCQRVPEEHVHAKMFIGGLSGYSKKPHTNAYAGARKKRILAQITRPDTEEALAKRVKRLSATSTERQAKLAAKGIKYLFTSGYAAAAQ